MVTAAVSSHFLKVAEDTTSLKSTVRPAYAHRDLLLQKQLFLNICTAFS